MTESTTPPTPPTEPPPTPPETPPDPELSGLDDRARQLIERANNNAAGYRHELRETQERLERLQREHESASERTLREAEERGRAAAQAEHEPIVAGYERQLATAAIRAQAASRFADPDDAVRLLDLDALLAERDESKRASAVDAALGELLKSKPYLAREKERGSLVTQGGRSQPPDGRPRERSWLRGG